jgi:hypothetical protein
MIPVLLTLGLPLAIGLLAALTVSLNDALLLPAIGLGLLAYPAGLFAGYAYVGAWMRGSYVAGGGVLLVLAGVALMVATPTAFEDAGTLVGLVAAFVALLLLAYAGWAAWDVHARVS